MSSFIFGIVAEGPTDYELITALINKIIPGDHTFLPIQPEISETSGFGTNNGFGTHGAGWKGVLNWCRSIAKNFPSLDSFLTVGDPEIDYLIIHIDADAAREPEINCYATCPPSSVTVENIKRHINMCLQEEAGQQKIVYCIPCDNTEAWVLCAFDKDTTYHNPPISFLECLQKPDYIICQPNYNRPNRLLKKKDGKPKKAVNNYRNNLIPKVLEEWDTIKIICSQAQIFENDLIISTRH